VDGDGNLADPDSGIATVTIQLWTDPNGDGDPSDGVRVTSTLTNGPGNYTFGGITPGNYVVVEVDPAGYSSTADTTGANDNRVPVPLISGTPASSKDFLDARPANISGQVREDDDGDGNLADPDSG